MGAVAPKFNTRSALGSHIGSEPDHMYEVLYRALENAEILLTRLGFYLPAFVLLAHTIVHCLQFSTETCLSGPEVLSLTVQAGSSLEHS